MRSVQAQVRRPNELLAAEADRGSLAVALALIVAGAERRGRRFGRCCDALVRGWSVSGESFQVDRDATEQELDVEGGHAAAAHPVESVEVLQFGDHAFGVGIRCR